MEVLTGAQKLGNASCQLIDGVVKMALCTGGTRSTKELKLLKLLSGTIPHFYYKF